MTRLGSNPRMMFAPGERYVPAAMDPNNPGVITYSKAKDAAAAGAQAPTSAAPQAAKSVLKSAVGGKIGDEINAFNTAMQHADLLKQAATALQNGDTRTLNSMKNSFQSEFGDPNLTNFNAIAGAYSREITKMLSAGHMTDKEISESGATLPSNANPATIAKVLESYKSLAASKMQQRKNQVEKGSKGQANFPENTTTAPVTGGFKPF